MNRRSFIRSAGGVAIAGFGGPLHDAGIAAARSLLGAEDRPRVAVFFDPGFPGADDFGLNRDQLSTALSDFKVTFLTAAEMETGLPGGGYRLLINPYGSAFPVGGWEAIRDHLSRGGSLLNLGGIPFACPVRRAGATWKQEIPQTAYHKRLGITGSFAVPVRPEMEVRDIPVGGAPVDLARRMSVTRVHECYFRFTSTRDFPGEDGSSGQRDATVTPLAGIFTPSGDMVAAPVVLVERHLGEFAGGRWIFVTSLGTLTAGAIATLALTAVVPPRSAAVVPTFATYYPGEIPAFRFTVHDHFSADDGVTEGGWTLTITDDAKRFRFHTTLNGRDLRRATAGAWVMPREKADGMKPGFYRVEGRFTPRSDGGRPTEELLCANGFWIHDPATMSAGAPLTVRGSAFYRAGKPYPVTGTSYMSDGVQRKFLFEPNPHLWDRDFREMKEAGINMVRTGIWTGWKNMMLDVGTVAEFPLRALDAFMLTAQRHDLPVIFTFFAFLPEAWGGENPYLDPRSVHAQKVFISAIASRYRNAPGIIWDLINEPSFSSPDHLWLCRPNYDRHELAEWKEWLNARGPDAGAVVSDGTTRERHRLMAGEEAALPAIAEFTDTNIIGGRRPLRVGEYRLFAQEMFRRWSDEMVAVLRAGTGVPRLVTVGQDEGGTYERPGPHFFAPGVDFTSMHNWWFNDDLLWDSIITTADGRPNLIGETGVMVYEKADGRPWRSESDARDLLERKLAISFAAGGAGFINWLWNSNPYMDSENEAGIGLKRADGSLKPEYDVVRQYAKFFSARAEWLDDPAPCDAVMVVPHSNMFSTRNSATEATKNCVRAMEYHCRIGLRSVSEYTLRSLTTPPRLLVFPSPSLIERDAWERLLTLVRSGSTLLVTGPIDHDPYLMPVARSTALGIGGTTAAVGAEEHLRIGGREYRLGYRGEKMQRIEKFVPDGVEPNAPFEVPVGKGSVIWSPLPVEVSDSVGALAALYRFAADRAGLASDLTGVSDDPSVLVRSIKYREALLVAFVSEAAGPRTITGTVAESGRKFSVAVPGRRTVINLHHRGDGSLIASLNPSLADAI